MTKRRRSRHTSNGLLALISRDQYGVVWLALLVLAVYILKWQVVQPPQLYGSPCVGCLEFMMWVLAILASFLGAGVWWAWTPRLPKGLTLMFLLPLAALAGAYLASLLATTILENLYYRGLLHWPEAEDSFLLDNFSKHAMGLYLGTAVLYGMVRLVLCKDLKDKRLVTVVSLGIALSAVGLLFLGIKLY